MTTIPEVTLNDGYTIPQLGFGTFQVPPEQTAATVQAALEAGYRHIDTAQMYRNEAGVGEGIRASGLAREDVYEEIKADGRARSIGVSNFRIVDLERLLAGTDGGPQGRTGADPDTFDYKPA